MPNYRMKYGEAGENVVTEELEDVDLEWEDGWVVVFRRGQAVLRLQEPHPLSLEEMPPGAS